MRIGLFIDHYNFQRVHQGIDGLVPADRFFGAASEVAKTLRNRVAENALQLARHGVSPAPFYVTGQVEGQAFSVHAEGPRLILTRPGQSRQEVELVGPCQDTPQAAQTPLPDPCCPSAVDASVDASIDEPSAVDASPESFDRGGNRS
jgi:hypothetical protein